MRNILLTLAYDGSGLHGWQVQKNAISVQELLQDALESVFGTRLPVTGCSRTDTGVHANMFCCNFKTESKIPCHKIILALNANLPFEIAVYDCKEVHEDFHARYDCLFKEYEYLILNTQTRNPFYKNRAWHYCRPLDESLLNDQAQFFLGRHDFSAFCASGTDVEDKVRYIKDISFTRQGDFLVFSVTADGFLYNMVRIIVGTLMQINEGKIEKNSIDEIIASKDRRRAGLTAPAEGLYLEKVYYDFGVRYEKEKE